MSRRKHQPPTREPRHPNQSGPRAAGHGKHPQHKSQSAGSTRNSGQNRHAEPARQQRPDEAPKQQHRRHGSTSHDGPVWLYGSHACAAALSNPARYCRRLVATREALAALTAAMGAKLPAQPQPEIADKARLDSLLPPGAVHQGIALQVEQLEDPGVESLEAELPGGKPEIVLALDQVTDPRNVGAILRSAAAFGVRAMVVTDRHAPEATGALAKAASGGLEVVPMLRVTNLVRALDLLAGYGYWRVGLEAETDKTLDQAVSGVKRLVLVMGAEDEGLRRLTREHCDFLAKLPMSGAVESLNVSAAAAIALYEAARRKP